MTWAMIGELVVRCSLDMFLEPGSDRLVSSAFTALIVTGDKGHRSITSSTSRKHLSLVYLILGGVCVCAASEIGDPILPAVGLARVRWP